MLKKRNIKEKQTLQEQVFFPKSRDEKNVNMFGYYIIYKKIARL